MEDIKEIYAAARAYLNNLPKLDKIKLHYFFHDIADADKDGKITLEEFMQIDEADLGDHVNLAFNELDQNGDGRLTFKEYITLYYCLKTRRTIECQGCKAFFLKGLYFTCVDCFENNKDSTFDVCISCYHSWNYVNHEHRDFLDNYELLHRKAACNNNGLPNQPTNLAKPVDGRSISKGESGMKAFKSWVDFGNSISGLANNAASCSCTIM